MKLPKLSVESTLLLKNVCCSGIMPYLSWRNKMEALIGAKRRGNDGSGRGTRKEESVLKASMKRSIFILNFIHLLTWYKAVSICITVYLY